MEGEEVKEEAQEEAKPKSMFEEVKEIQADIIKQKEEILAASKALADKEAEALLSGTAGGHIEAPKVSPEDLKVKGALEFFKGTSLEGAIKKANEQE